MTKVNLGELRETLFEAIKSSDIGIVRQVLVEAGKSKKYLLAMPIKVEGILEEVDALQFAKIIADQRPHSYKKNDVVNAISGALKQIGETERSAIELSYHEDWPKKSHMAYPEPGNEGQPELTSHRKKIEEMRRAGDTPYLGRGKSSGKPRKGED